MAIPTTSRRQRSLAAALALFLDTATKTALHRAELVSKSALSRLLNEYDWDTAQGWFVLQEAQRVPLRLAARRQHRPLLRLSVDLTSIEKKGSDLPFVRVYNEVHGIHLVVLFGEYGPVKVPVGDRVFHAVSSELLEGDEVVAEGKARWSEESLFKEGKHPFGLSQFALRTATGLDRWVLLMFLAWTLAILHRETGMTLEASAALALKTVMPDVHLNRLL